MSDQPSDNSLNPYATPSSAEASQREEALKRWSQRPFGVTVIAGMLIVRGVTSLFKAAVMGLAGQSTLSFGDTVAFTSRDAPQASILLLIFFSLLGIVAALGGLRGKAWAWSLGIALGTARLILYAAVLYGLAREGHSMAMGENIVRVAAIVAAMGYAMREPVVRFMGITQRRFLRRMLAAVANGGTMGAAIAIWIEMSA